MILDQLKTFHAIVKHGGFARASESIHLSQPAISMRIKDLETELGVELFNRSRRRGGLTDAGKIVEEYSARVMIVLSEMKQAIDDLKGLQRGQLRCGATTTIAVHLLPKVLVQFKRQFPNIEVRLRVGNTAETEKRIVADEIDIGLVTQTTANPSRFKSFHLLTDHFVVITPRDHPLAKFSRVSLKQLTKFPLILRDKGTLPRQIIDESFRAAGVAYNCTMEIETAEALKRAVTEGLGISIVSHCSIQTENEMGLLSYAMISTTPVKRTFIAIIHEDKNLAGPIKPFLELLRSNINPYRRRVRFPNHRR